jgi:hypothetical protein
LLWTHQPYDHCSTSISGREALAPPGFLFRRRRHPVWRYNSIRVRKGTGKQKDAGKYGTGLEACGTRNGTALCLDLSGQRPRHTILTPSTRAILCLVPSYDPFFTLDIILSGYSLSHPSPPPRSSYCGPRASLDPANLALLRIQTSDPTRQPDLDWPSGRPPRKPSCSTVQKRVPAAECRHRRRANIPHRHRS